MQLWQIVTLAAYVIIEVSYVICQIQDPCSPIGKNSCADNAICESSYQRSQFKFIAQCRCKYGWSGDPYVKCDTCSSDDLYMPYINREMKVECHGLLTEGPCGEGYWFTLNQNYEGACRKRDCPNEDDILVRGTCMSTKSKELKEVDPRARCPKYNMRVKTNLFGYGECVCKDFFLTYRSNITEAILGCYKEGYRGPCPGGYQLEESSNSDGETIGECVTTGCPKLEQIKWKDGKCYTDPKCDDGESRRFKVYLDELGLNLVCEYNERLPSIFYVPETCGEGWDFDGDNVCRQISSGRRRPYCRDYRENDTCKKNYGTARQYHHKNALRNYLRRRREG